MGGNELTGLALDNVRAGAVHDSDDALCESGRVQTCVDPCKRQLYALPARQERTMSSRLNTNQSDSLIPNEVIECPDGITATSNTCHDSIRQLAPLLRQLRLDLPPDDALEVSHDSWEGVRANGRPDQVMCIFQSCHPLPHRLVDCILEGLCAGCDRDDLLFSGYTGSVSSETHISAQHLDTENVQLLSSDILGPHVDVACHAELGTNRSRSNTVLASTRLGDDTSLSQTLGKQYLRVSARARQGSRRRFTCPTALLIL